nr:unnamed protein product [Digitaria exilis]
MEKSKLEFWVAEFGSFDKLLQALRWRSGFFTIARPNVAFLRQHGLNISDTTSASMYYPRLFNINPELLKEAVQRVEELA